MNTTTKIVLGVVILGAITYLGVSYPKSVTSVVSLGAVGSTFNTAKIAAVNMAPLTSAASSTSLLNTDAGTRFVSSGFANCTGASNSYSWPNTTTGIATLIVKAATSSTAAQSANTNSALILNVATSTVNTVNASSTPANTNANDYTWASGEYLTFTFNATSTAACVVGVNYIPS